MEHLRQLGFDRFLIFLVFLVILLRLPSLFEPYWYGDEGIYLTLGEGVKKGLVLYREIHDNKPPLLYLLAAASGNLANFRFLLLICSLAAVSFFYFFAQKVFPQEKNLVRVATFSLAVLSSLTLIEGNIANAENFMFLTTLAGLFFAWQTQKPKTLFLAGLLFSFSTLLKVPAAFDFAALGAFLIFFSQKSFKENLTQVFFLTLGFLTPLLVTFIVFSFQNALPEYFKAAFAQNIPYLSSWQTGSHSQLTPSGISLRGLIFAALLSLTFVLRKRLPQNLLFTIIWFLFTLFAALLSGRPYPHYLLQVVPPLSLLLALLLYGKALYKLTSFLLLSLVLFSVYYLRFWSYPTLKYYQNFLKLALGQESKEQYRQNFNEKVPQTYRVASFLTTHTQPEEKVFIWGDSPAIYALSRKLPVGRYTASYHILDFKGQAETIKVLNNQPPRFIVNLTDEQNPYPEFFNFLSQNYVFFAKIDHAEIYRRVF